ncbi:MAG: DUF2288 domain-containing protein [Labilithrix sp.]|nr:DUF2288 domain-containing protein [Labilithrix sp.]MCW5809522.1 DUF2288 domain-containing protein [Labilithrix sp.]
MREQLVASMGPVEVSDLRAHLARDAVIVVDASLDLLTVAEAVARDDKEQVGAWIARSLIGKPTLETLERWSKSPPPLVSVVVQPFVLVSEKRDPTAN